jgi:hypothetical protein
MSAPLIGHSRSSAFRLSTGCGVDVTHGLVLLFGTAPRPFHHGTPCLAMPVAPLPVWRASVQVHGCHHQYAHDLTGWHRHDNNCRTPR